MGPRETKLREQAAVTFPPDGARYFEGDILAQHSLVCARVLDALEEALAGWDPESAGYERLRAVLKEADGGS